MSLLIVSFRWTRLDSADAAVSAAESVFKQAQALGGTLVGFGGIEVTFAFDPEQIEAVLPFVVESVKSTRYLARAGLAEGEIVPFMDGPSQDVRLAWGMPMVIASSLARAAQLGEVLVDGELSAIRRGRVRLVGSGKDVPIAGAPRATSVLDLEQPVGDGTPSLRAERNPEPVEPAPSSSVPPPRRRTGSFQLLELAREALARTDATSLDMALAELGLTDQHAEVVERLAGVLAMTRGAKEEGLRVLRRAAEAEQAEDRRARSVLAYAIGVAAAGRSEDALLEALSALAIARSQGDAGGEKACARFLAQLSQNTGHPEAASAWEHVAQRFG